MEVWCNAVEYFLDGGDAVGVGFSEVDRVTYLEGHVGRFFGLEVFLKWGVVVGDNSE